MMGFFDFIDKDGIGIALFLTLWLLMYGFYKIIRL